MRNIILIVIVLLISGGLGVALSLYHHRAEEPIPLPGPPDVQLIKTFHSPISIVKQLEGDPHAGRKIFKEFCTSCHSAQPIIDINAPRIGDKKMWGALSKLGMPTLLSITIKGVNAMPARGGCFECSDAQLQMAIEYIIQNSR